MSSLAQLYLPGAATLWAAVVFAVMSQKPAPQQQPW